MLKRDLSQLLHDQIAYWALRQIRRRADQRGGLQLPFAVPMNDLIGQRLIATGNFELTQLDAVDQLVEDATPLIGFKPDFAGAFVDVGANIGVYTLRYARAFTKTIAIEPNPAALHILQANIALSRISNVVPMLKGCSDRVGTAQLNVAAKGMLGWSTLGADPYWENYAIEVSLDTLDNLVLQAELRERVAFLKIDVEGHEPQVLRGAFQTLSDHRPAVLYEVLSNTNARACAELLRAAGYNHFVTFHRRLTLAGALGGLPVTARTIEPSAVDRETLILALHDPERDRITALPKSGSARPGVSADSLGSRPQHHPPRSQLSR
jgi:FkbM family methyltransferase